MITATSVSSLTYPSSLVVRCAILMPKVFYTYTDSGFVSFDFNCVANPRMVESPITHLFFIGLS